MIRIFISGDGVGKTKIAQTILRTLRLAGFVTIEVYTTNLEIPIDPTLMNRERE